MNPSGFQPQAGAEPSARELGSPGPPQAAMIPPQQGQNLGQAPYQSQNYATQIGLQGNYHGYGNGSAANVDLGMPVVDPSYLFMPQHGGGAVVPNTMIVGYRPVIPEQVSIFTNSRDNSASFATGRAPAAFNYSGPNAYQNTYHGVAYSVGQSLPPNMPVVAAAPSSAPAEQTGDLPDIEEETAEDVEMSDGGGSWPGRAPNQSYGNWGPDGRQ